MPIPVSTLDQVNRPLRDRVLEFLRKTPEQAYNATEIYGGVEGLSDSGLAAFMLLSFATKDSSILAPLLDTLTKLEQEGLIRSASHQNTTYYAIRQQ
jgi:hypothetical protein